MSGSRTAGAVMETSPGADSGGKPIPIENFVIVVNGRKKDVKKELLTFDEVVSLAFDDPQRGPNVIFTVTFRNAKEPKGEGSLLEGQVVEIKEGTVFNVTRTDKS
jgi:hypothetical protein